MWPVPLRLVLGVGLLFARGKFDLFDAALVFAIGGVSALACFGVELVRDLAHAVSAGHLRDYRRVWMEMTRWSALGVVTSEMTINAHAYLVTFICGPQAFALIAVGALFTRPFLLVLATLPDREAPAMARLIAGGELKRAMRGAREFVLVLGLIWLGNAASARFSSDAILAPSSSMAMTFTASFSASACGPRSRLCVAQGPATV